MPNQTSVAMSDDGSVTPEMIQALRLKFLKHPTSKIVQNAVTNGRFVDVALDRSLVQSMNSTFSIKLDLSLIHI